MKTYKRFKYVEIGGKRWFQKTYGNTYHTVYINIDGEWDFKSEKQYGYGEGYLQTAFEILKNIKFFPKAWTYGDFCSFRMNSRSKFIIHCADVARERDL